MEYADLEYYPSMVSDKAVERTGLENIVYMGETWEAMGLDDGCNECLY